MEKVKINKKITAIIEKNLDEQTVKSIKKMKSCKECRFHDSPWIWGSPLHVCSEDSDNPKTSRKVEQLYNECPLNGEIELTETRIKKYGIIINKNDYGNSIAIVDFSPSCWESDGHNPEISWENVAIFYYENGEDEEKMMKMALDYYEKFGFDKEYTKKKCYG